MLLPPAPNDKPITGVAADDNGHFSLTKLAAGPARLCVSYVGFGTQTRAVTITAGATDAGTFRLPTAGTALAEAVVIGTKPVVEVRPDRIIYNSDQDVTNAGGTASDVLRKAPLLAVDGDGNVKMRGSTSYRLPKSFTVQAFFYGSLPSPELQDRDWGYIYSSLGIKKLLFKDQADLTLNVSNPFNRYTAYGSTLSTAFLEERQEYRSYQRGLRVSFGYRFGQEQQSKRCKSISDDVKGAAASRAGSSEWL